VTCGYLTNHSPYFNMVHLFDDSSFELIVGKGTYFRRQDAPESYQLTTVCFVAKPEYLLSCEHIFEGKVGLHVVDDVSGLDIDNDIDLKLANLIHDENPCGFKL
jgi:CMP-N-acetylneuraminic acid synthetase